MSLHGFPSVTPFILSHGATRGGFSICLYMAFPLSLHSSYRTVKRGVVFAYVSTWLCLCHAICRISQGKVCEIVSESGEIVSQSGK